MELYWLSTKIGIHLHPVGHTSSKKDASFIKVVTFSRSSFLFSFLITHTHLVGATVSEVDASFGRTTAALFRDRILIKSWRKSNEQVAYLHN